MEMSIAITIFEDMKMQNLKLEKMILQEENKKLREHLLKTKSNMMDQYVLGLVIVVLVIGCYFSESYG